jgi:hypothetical protein
MKSPICCFQLKKTPAWRELTIQPRCFDNVFVCCFRHGSNMQCRGDPPGRSHDSFRGVIATALSGGVPPDMIHEKEVTAFNRSGAYFPQSILPARAAVSDRFRMLAAW